MRVITLKRFSIYALLIVGGFFILFRFVMPSSLSIKQIGVKKPVDSVFVGPEKYQNSFGEALNRAEESAAPFRRAGQLMEAGEYDAALEALNESLLKSTRSIEKTMVYRRRQVVFNKLGNLEKELEAIESWFAEAGKNANNPDFERRAAEIRQILSAQKEQKKKI